MFLLLKHSWMNSKGGNFMAYSQITYVNNVAADALASKSAGAVPTKKLDMVSSKFLLL